MTVNDAAIKLNLAPRTVRNYIETGRLNAVQIEGRWHLSAASVAEFAAIPRRKGPPKGQPAPPGRKRGRKPRNQGDMK